MATQLKAISAATPGMVVHIFDNEHGSVVEVPVAALGLDTKGQVHPIILARKLDEEDLCVGCRFVCADKFPDYCRTLFKPSDDDEEQIEAEDSATREIASNKGLIDEDEDPEAEDDDEESVEDDDSEETGASAVRMSSGEI